MFSMGYKCFFACASVEEYGQHQNQTQSAKALHRCFELPHRSLLATPLQTRRPRPASNNDKEVECLQ